MTVSVTVLLAAGYAMALLAGALGLDLLAQHTHRRSERFRTAGFRYHPQHDVWVCPEDQYLWPYEYDAERRLMRYRAKPSICNACPVKAGCTSSHHGREVVRPLDPWPHSEAGRFHRGLALALVGIAGLFAITVIAVVRSAGDAAVVIAVLALVGLAGWRLTNHFRHTPANFPTGTGGHLLRTESGAHAPLVNGAVSRRTRWWSDQRRISNDMEIP